MTMKTTKKSFWLWPSIYDLKTAINANKQGFIAAIWCASWSFLFAAGQIIFEKTTPNFLVLMNVVAFIVVAWGIYKKIKVAPIVGLVFYLIPQIIYRTEWHKNILFGMIISLAFITSIRGVFAYHKFNNELSREK